MGSARALPSSRPAPRVMGTSIQLNRRAGRLACVCANGLLPLTEYPIASPSAWPLCFDPCLQQAAMPVIAGRKSKTESFAGGRGCAQPVLPACAGVDSPLVWRACSTPAQPSPPRTQPPPRCMRPPLPPPSRAPPPPTHRRKLHVHDRGNDGRQARPAGWHLAQPWRQFCKGEGAPTYNCCYNSCCPQAPFTVVDGNLCKT